MTDTPSADEGHEMHSLLCPVCRVALTMSDRQGIEIDYCPQCRGVWLDRGELDKLIDRTAAYEAGARPAQAQPPQGPEQQGDRTQASPYAGESDWRDRGSHHHRRHGGHHGGGHGWSGRRGFLGELFDN